MSFVFVSHAVADKPKLRALTDALIASGVKIWIDDPGAMNYSEAEIEGHFIDLRGGRRWKDQIIEALETAHCVLVCCSHTFVANYAKVGADGGPSTIHAEVSKGDGKLVACRIDDIAFRTLPGVISKEQVVDLWGLEGPRREQKLGRLITDIKSVMAATERLHARLIDERLARFGAFAPRGGKAVSGLSEEQCGALLSMMDRDSAVQSLLQMEGLGLLSCDVSARPRTLAKRLIEIELPLRTCLPKLRELAVCDDARRVKANLVCGALGQTGRTWEAAFVPWPTEQGEGARAFADFVERIADNLFPGERALAGERVIDLLKRMIETSSKRFLIWSDVNDVRQRRRENEIVLKHLAEALSGFDPNRLRLLVRVAPQPSLLGFSPTAEWLKTLCPPSGPVKAVSLGLIERNQLIGWENLVTTIAEADEAKLSEALDRLYGNVRGVAFDRLEREMKSFVQGLALAGGLMGQARAKAPTGDGANERA